MNFGVNRLHTDEESSRRFHLHDDKRALKLVVDYGSVWLPSDAKQQARFADPGGELIALLDLSEEEQARNGRLPTSYPLILNHAVYAIITKHQETGADGALPHYIIEADGISLLAWISQQKNTRITFFDQYPKDISHLVTDVELAAFDPVGIIDTAQDEYDWTGFLSLPQISHTALIASALIFLVERHLKI